MPNELKHITLRSEALLRRYYCSHYVGGINIWKCLGNNVSIWQRLAPLKWWLLNSFLLY